MSFLFIANVNDGILVPKAFSKLIPLLLLSRLQNCKKHKEEDAAVMNSHLTISNLLFVRQFTYQNKGNLFLFLILRYIFNLHLRKRNIAQDSLLGRVLIRDALQF